MRPRGGCRKGRLHDEHLHCLDGSLGVSVTLWKMWRRLDMGDLPTAAEFSKLARC